MVDTKRERRTHTKFDQRDEWQAQLSEWTDLSQIGGHSATLIENGSNIYIYLFSILNYKTD